MAKNNRKSERLKVKTAIARTSNQVCQIIDINKNGCSFKCATRRPFSEVWSMDLYDTSGINLEQLRVKKIWQQCLPGHDETSPFPMEIGVQFKNLSRSQKALLTSYLQKLREIKIEGDS